MGNVCSSNDSEGTVEKVADADSKMKEQPMAAAEPEEPKAPATEEPKLLITIVGARGLRDSDWMPGSGKPDCFCIVKTGETELYKTKVISDACEPVWAEQCKVPEIADTANLEFHIYDKDLIGQDFLGKAVLEAKDYTSKGWNGELKVLDPKAPQAYIKVKVKLAGKDLPPGPPAEITVNIEKANKESSFGLDLDTQDPTSLYVLEVKSGPFYEYNAKADPEMQVKPNDIIVSVNGKSGSTDDMLGEFKSQTKVEVKIRRSVLANIIFDRGTAQTPLGLVFPERAQGDLLVIRGIEKEGAAAAYNAAVKEQEQLCVGDRIIAVGKTKDKASVMQTALEQKVSGKVQLVLFRPAILKSESESGVLGGILHWLF